MHCHCFGNQKTKLAGVVHQSLFYKIQAIVSKRKARAENEQNQDWGFVMFAHADVRLLEVKMLVVTL